jgi:DNA-binding GntR family transcriptional regulator
MPAATPGGPQAGEAARAHAFAAIRQAILSGDLAPGRRLVEEDLASALGVTRQSLRAALLDLTAEGLVERVPNRGARVRVVTAEEAVAITECRMALEALCAVKAAQRITDAEAVQLRELGENLKRSVADGNPLRYSELNRELHRRIGAISAQHVAIGLLDRLHGQLVRAAPRSRWPSTWPSSRRSPTAGHTTPTSPSERIWPASSRRCRHPTSRISRPGQPQTMTFPAMSSPDLPTFRERDSQPDRKETAC